VQAWLPVGPGKRVGHRELNALGGGMIFLQDDDSKQQFMVDTGAVCSVLPHRSNAQPAGPQLSGADGRSIPTWGTIRRRLSFGLRTFFVTFFLAAVSRPILGLDSLSALRLLVDPECSGTFHQGCSARWHRSNTGKRFSSRCTLYTTRECE
jgi:hypothetical protein